MQGVASSGLSQSTGATLTPKHDRFYTRTDGFYNKTMDFTLKMMDFTFKMMGCRPCHDHKLE